LGRKLASLAFEYCITHIAATLQDLIQQVEQSTSASLNAENQEMIQNPLQINTKGRLAKRLKLCVENISKNREGKTRSGDGYECQNCLKDGHNSRSCATPCKSCKEIRHTYLYCLNKENS
ncbi:8756_t:CDS:1, partial [Funneliformis caledonium]